MPYVIGFALLAILVYANRFIAREIILSFELTTFYISAIFLVCVLGVFVWISASKDRSRTQALLEEARASKRLNAEAEVKRKEDEQQRLDEERQKEQAAHKTAQMQRHNEAIKEKLRNSLHEMMIHADAAQELGGWQVRRLLDQCITRIGAIPGLSHEHFDDKMVSAEARAVEMRLSQLGKEYEPCLERHRSIFEISHERR